MERTLPRTRVSSKGQVIIPKGVRERHGWSAGVELEVDDLGDSVVLRRARQFRPTKVEDVYGCLKYDGPPISVAAMDEAVQREARKRR
jgi:AbrB family looped-hinge helix DNA binding protein